MRGDPEMGVIFKRGGGKHCFSLVMYEYFSNNPLSSACLSFMFILFKLILIPETVIISNRSSPGVAYKSVAYKKSMWR